MMMNIRHKDHNMDIHPKRKSYLIASALWEYIANDRKKPEVRQNSSNVHDIEQILDEDYPAELDLLMRAERLKDRS